MAVRGWAWSVTTAIGVAAAVGAAQLGLGYGLGVVKWQPAADAVGEAVWVGSLAWTTWIAATSVVVGALCGDRLTPPGGAAGTESALAGALWRVVLGAAAAVGALTTVALVAVPARAAERADTFSPQTIAGGYAALGVLIGLLVAVWAVASRAVAANVLLTTGWLWLLAIAAVLDGVVSGDRVTHPQLGVWHLTSNDGAFWLRNIYLPGAALALGSAVVIGVAAAWRPAMRSDNRVGTAVSGGMGPLLVAAAYFLAAPSLVGVRAEQLSAHLVAPYTVIAGLAGSVLVTALGQRAATRPKRAALSSPGQV